MRPQRFQQFAIDAYQAAGMKAEPWSEGTKRPLGVALTLPNGAQLRHAVSGQSRDGDAYGEAEQPVEGEAPAPVPVPDLGRGAEPRQVEAYLAAVLTNTGHPEILRAYAYGDREQPPKHAGVGVVFHSGAKVYCLFV
ncbi:hypothetical protein [Streptomyces avicenniae]|uniref:hypothetical protein n=1 Tax=Streptomyces avicenniae TaxID=500153 RepID=UPI00069A2A44|nr:hypothetical protein [Streptomyces avicenniae]